MWRTCCPNWNKVTARLGALKSISGCWSWRNSSCVPRTAVSRHRDCYAFLSGNSALQGGLLKKCIDTDKRLTFDPKKRKNNLCQIVYQNVVFLCKNSAQEQRGSCCICWELLLNCLLEDNSVWRLSYKSVAHINSWHGFFCLAGYLRGPTQIPQVSHLHCHRWPILQVWGLSWVYCILGKAEFGRGGKSKCYMVV